ncbi:MULTISPECIES: hypothetical protein [unclassified Curtobacterium]|uniref:hypothetical protein n=1 Tax=unclassified Curtobacterium TaxID=257496 RepID=UPI000D8F96E8|nr:MULTISPECIES: hypothetical protein [unclassified Curtobacterium]PYY36337.1 hypothetical protein DEJ32_13310 [Curtobacterium sp. MCPF17_046]WIB14754.1 hypothetical protein DEJ34_11430 [Curtobacterium sp. MCPF17_050]
MVIGVVLTVIGLVGHQLALWWNSIPLPEGTGANIGAGVAALAALLVAVGGLVTLVVGGLLRARGGSDPRVGG